MGGASVTYICRATHSTAAGKRPDVASPITVHEGAWAYCAVGAVSGHEWEAIEPVSLTSLKIHELGKSIA